MANITGSNDPGQPDDIEGTNTADFISLLAGDDRARGLYGNDIMYGGEGADTLLGGAGYDFLQGDAGDDLLNGGAGYDNLVGGAGADEMLGGDGNDLIQVGNFADMENDTVDGGDGIDTLFADFAAADARVRFSARDYLLPNNGRFDLRGVEIYQVHGSIFSDQITGANFGDFLTGNLGNDEISGRGGNDALQGGDGNDELFGDNGSDNLQGGIGGDLLEGGRGNDGMNGGADNDTLSGGQGFDQLNGDSGNDLVEGGVDTDYIYDSEAFDINGVLLPANDTLRGGDGNDFIYSGFGDDLAEGGVGDDIFYWADDLSGADTVDGGEGIDSLVFYGNTGAYIDLSRQGNNDGAAAGDIYSGIERFVGSALDDVMLGSRRADDLSGGGSDDVLDGKAGNDRLDGGAGPDQLTGGRGRDVFVLSNDFFSPSDIVTDFASGDDKIEIFKFNFLISDTNPFKITVGDDPQSSGTGAQFLFESDNHRLWWDQDGSGQDYDPILIATLEGVNTLSQSDFILI